METAATGTSTGGSCRTRMKTAPTTRISSSMAVRSQRSWGEVSTSGRLRRRYPMKIARMSTRTRMRPSPGRTALNTVSRTPRSPLQCW